MNWTLVIHLVTLSVMLFGLAGLIIPLLPGLVIIWLAGLAYGLAKGFTWGSGAIFAVMTVLMLVGSVIDNVIMGASARKQGASWVSIAIATVLGILGSLVFPPFGGLIAALLGIFAYEFYRLKNWRKALESTRGMAMGCGWSTLVRAVIGALMIGLWIVWAILL